MEFVPRELEWQRHNRTLTSLMVLPFKVPLHRHSRSHAALPFKVPGNKIQDKNFQVLGVDRPVTFEVVNILSELFDMLIWGWHNLEAPFGLAVLAVCDATWKLECAATIMQLLLALRNALLEYFEINYMVY